MGANEFIVKTNDSRLDHLKPDLWWKSSICSTPNTLI